MGNSDRPHVKAGPVKYTKGFRTKRLIAKAIYTLIVLFISSIVFTSIFVFYKQPVKTESGYITAEQIHGFFEHGEKVIVVNDERFHLFTPLERFIFTQEAYLAKVVAGPYGEIEKTKGKHRVSDGTNVTRVNLEVLDKEYLDMEYIVRKIRDDGTEIQGEPDSIITKERVLGGFNEDI